MIQRFWICLLSAAYLLALAASLPAQVISVTPRFVAGERAHLLIETSRNDQRADQSARTPVTVTVQSVSAEGALLIWESGETEIQNAPPEALELIRAMNSAVDALSLECEFNSLGEFIGLRNEAEVLDDLQRGVAAMTQAMLAKTPDQQTRDRLRQVLEQLLQPETLLGTTTKNVILYAGAAQMELDLDEPVSIETEMESPFGTTVLSLLTVTAHDWNDGDNTVAIDVVSEPTSESVAALTRAVLQRMLRTEEAAKLEEAMKDFKLVMRDETTYEVDLSRGWPTTVDFSRVMNVQRSQRVDRTRITLQRVEAP